MMLDFHVWLDFQKRAIVTKFLIDGIGINLAERDRDFGSPELIKHLIPMCFRVPLLKFRSHDGTCVDLQFNNIGSIRSSLFVRTCVEVIVPIVIHWLNSLFDVVKLKDSRNGLFSSYHLNMLALHFLQSDRRAIPFPVTRWRIHGSPSISFRNILFFCNHQIFQG
ncbi:unnamed protein product [Haemonchus placei]|uniref:Uncharacterized protein n=1 Tax=Haemonchus placei TaxID=6290 RepID=A0A3P7XS83_HAEPC|nr:unnamed protein product [Haemonchus placei]